MHSYSLTLLLSGVLGAFSASLQPRATACVNSASDRSCWSDGYDLSTNYYDDAPDTGVIREYWFNIENTTVAPDGVEIPAQLVNGSYPGPTIIADWGDTIVVHVSNSLQNNGTGIHFHGIRQNGTNQMDGTSGITQCPIAPGDSLTYTWRAVQYGTSWYHSHFYVQTWDGLFGGILINGPASANYDVDLGHIFVNDWYHVGTNPPTPPTAFFMLKIDQETADSILYQAATTGPATPQNGLINGTNTYNDTSGSRFETTFEAGTRYRIRLVNAAADNHFRFMIDNHTLEVIANDLVPIVPYNTTDLSIGMGERYDVIVTAKDLTSGDFWLRAITQTSCSSNDAADNIKGIIRYDNSSTADPTTSAYSYTDSCLDEDASNLVPYLAIDAAASDEVSTNALGMQTINDTTLWAFNSTVFRTKWENPTLLQVADGNDTWTSAQEVIQLPDADEWVYLVVNSPFVTDHPMHLHGHDFWVLGTGFGEFDETQAGNLTLVNAPRRDSAMLPSAGYMVIALKTDNPGAWLMHCHIAWHSSAGFDVQLLERESEITYDYDTMSSTCANWKAYAAKDKIVQPDIDSGV